MSQRCGVGLLGCLSLGFFDGTSSVPVVGLVGCVVGTGLSVAAVYDAADACEGRSLMSCTVISIRESAYEQ